MVWEVPLLHKATPSGLRGYLAALLMVTLATFVGLIVAPRWGNTPVDLLYLPAVICTAMLGGFRPALSSALASAILYNFFFTAPRYSLRIDSPADLMTVVVLFMVALATSHLASSVARQAQIAAAHASRNATIAGLARRLLSCTSEHEIVEVAVGQLSDLFRCNAVLVRSPGVEIMGSAPAHVALAPGDVAAAELTLETGEPAGRAVARAGLAEWQFHPMRSEARVLAAIGLARDDGAPPILPEQWALLENLIDQVALALERCRLEREARDFAALRDRDRLRSTLLSTIGHDLSPRVARLLDAVGRVRRNSSGEKEAVTELGAETLKLERYVSNLAELGLDGDPQPVRVGEVTIDLLQRSVRRAGEEVHLPPKEYGVLAELAKHRGRVLTHAQLLRAVWGVAHERQTDYLRVAVRGLRQKLEPDPARPQLILNEPAVGYRLV